MDLGIPEQNNIPILVYHKIDNRMDFGISSVTPNMFELHIKELYNLGFQCIGISESFNQSSKIKGCCIVFDDAYENVYINAFPILKKYGFTATIAVITDFVGKNNSWDVHFGYKFKHATWEQLKVLVENGWEIASHTCSHRSLTMLQRNEIKNEVLDSKIELQNRLNIAVRHLVYPFGRFNNKIMQITAASGYNSAAGFKTSSYGNQYCLPRQAVYRTDRSIINKIHGSMLETAKTCIINLCSNATIAVKELMP
ncbi:polysaccharide deacetylase family protein [bacterium]|nr:polysaccharide deacetylase family protein [bacterium]